MESDNDYEDNDTARSDRDVESNNSNNNNGINSKIKTILIQYNC